MAAYIESHLFLSHPREIQCSVENRRLIVAWLDDI